MVALWVCSENEGFAVAQIMRRQLLAASSVRYLVAPVLLVRVAAVKQRGDGRLPALAAHPEQELGDFSLRAGHVAGAGSYSYHCICSAIVPLQKCFAAALRYHT